MTKIIAQKCIKDLKSKYPKTKVFAIQSFRDDFYVVNLISGKSIVDISKIKTILPKKKDL